MNQTTDGKMNQNIMKESSSHSTEIVDGMQIDGNEDSADKSAEEHPTKRRRLFSSMDATTSLMEQVISTRWHETQVITAKDKFWWNTNFFLCYLS